MITLNPNINFDYNFEYIFRQDTNTFGEREVLKEVREWEYILTDILHKTPSYLIRFYSESTRAENFLAQTSRKRGETLGSITMGKNFIDHHSNPDIFHSVIAHETIHSMEGCFNHQKPFKLVGMQLMNIVKGIKIATSITDPGYRDWHNQKRASRGHNWKIVCRGCGQVLWRARACDLTKNPGHYKCGVCGDKFEVFHIENGMEVKYIHIAV